MSIKLSIFLSFWDEVEITKGIVNKIKTWNTKSKSVEESKNGCFSRIFLIDSSTKLFILLFLTLVMPNSAIFFLVLIRL